MTAPLIPPFAADATAVARPPPFSTGGPVTNLPPSRLSLGTSELRDRLVGEAAKQHGVPPDLAIAVSHVENWRGVPTAHGKGGEVGLMQVMPDIHGATAQQLENPSHNAELGVKILRMYFDRYGTWDKALRAYNGALKLPRAGDRYVAKVRAAQMKIGGANATQEGNKP